MKYPPITLELLKSKKACQPQLDLFQTHFGEGSVPLTEEVFTKFASEFDIGWAAYTLLNSEDRNEYNEVADPAYAKYTKVCDSAWAEYQKVRAPAWAEYQKVRNPGLSEYIKVCASAYA